MKRENLISGATTLRREWWSSIILKIGPPPGRETQYQEERNHKRYKAIMGHEARYQGRWSRNGVDVKKKHTYIDTSCIFPLIFFCWDELRVSRVAFESQEITDLSKVSRRQGFLKISHRH